MSRMAPSDHPRAKNPDKWLIQSLLILAGPNARVETTAVQPWASATFQGSRHKIAVIFEGSDAQDDAARFAEHAPEAEFKIAGHIVADLAIDGRWIERDAASGQPVVRVAASALLIEDW